MVKKRLTVAKERLRRLGTGALAQVAGGLLTDLCLAPTANRQTCGGAGHAECDPGTPA